MSDLHPLGAAVGADTTTPSTSSTSDTTTQVLAGALLGAGLLVTLYALMGSGSDREETERELDSYRSYR